MIQKILKYLKLSAEKEKEYAKIEEDNDENLRIKFDETNAVAFWIQISTE